MSMGACISIETDVLVCDFGDKQIEKNKTY